MNEHLFDSRDDASVAAAERLGAALARRLALRPAASLVVPGGTSPSRCFESLAGSELDWTRVHVILSDERWVPADDEDSNERLVRATLLTGHAAEALLLPAYRPGMDAAAGAAALDASLRLAPFPFAATLLGMGTDGHFASLFPDAANLDLGLDAESDRLAIAVDTAASPHPRISLTLAALSRSDEIVLLVFGEDKRAVLEQAQQKSSTLPVSRLLFQKRAPVRVYWAP